MLVVSTRQTGGSSSAIVPSSFDPNAIPTEILNTTHHVHATLMQQHERIRYLEEQLSTKASPDSQYPQQSASSLSSMTPHQQYLCMPMNHALFRKYVQTHDLCIGRLHFTKHITAFFKANIHLLDGTGLTKDVLNTDHIFAKHGIDEPYGSTYNAFLMDGRRNSGFGSAMTDRKKEFVGKLAYKIALESQKHERGIMLRCMREGVVPTFAMLDKFDATKYYDCGRIATRKKRSLENAYDPHGQTPTPAPVPQYRDLRNRTIGLQQTPKLEIDVTEDTPQNPLEHGLPRTSTAPSPNVESRASKRSKYFA